MPPKAKNAIAPMTTHMMMLFIVHLRFVSPKGPIPPDGAHYALFPFPRLLEIQRKSNEAKRRPGVPLRALGKDLRHGFESWSRNHLLSSSAILSHPNAAIVAIPC